MDYFTIVLIGLALSMDILAVSITAAATSISKAPTVYKSALLAAVFFGGFQVLMPMLGWLMGLGIKEFIMGIDHWLAFVLLGFIGAKMVINGLKKDGKPINLLNLSALILLSIAINIDAFIVGITFAFMVVSIFPVVLILGTIAFIASFTGVLIGNKFGETITGRKAQILGGIALFGIGLKILIEHTLL